MPSDVKSLNDKHAMAARAGDVTASKLLAHITIMRMQRFMGGNHHQSAALKHAMRYAWRCPELVAVTTSALLGDVDALDVLDFRSDVDGLTAVDVVACSLDERQHIAETVDAVLELSLQVFHDDVGAVVPDDFVYRDSISRNAP